MYLFKKFKTTTPRGLVPNGPTVQGVYCMTADGEYLSGCFAFAWRDKAKRVVEHGWQRFQQLARQRGYKPKPVPRNKLDFSQGKSQRGGIKLEAAVRDLPRGSDQRPGRGAFAREAFNLGWLTYTAEEALRFVTTSRQRTQLPTAMLFKMAQANLKDSVRGQCSSWKKGALRDGALYTQLVHRDGNRLTLRITGNADLRQQGRTFGCRLHGKAVYDDRKREFVSFDLVAAGQRTGRDHHNARNNDLGPAPMGVAFTLYR